MPKPIIHLLNVRFRWPGEKSDLLYIPELIVNQGEHLFIQGPSGSGKTTLLNLLTGINLPTAGSITVLDTPLERLNNTRRDQFRADHLGVIFQQFNLLPYLSLLENVQLPCGFSQQQRTAVARALIGSPEIVIADEPTSALDTDNRDRFLELLFQETEKQGSTLVFVSHDQHIAQQFAHVVNLADFNADLNQGQFNQSQFNQSEGGLS